MHVKLMLVLAFFVAMTIPSEYCSGQITLIVPGTLTTKVNNVIGNVYGASGDTLWAKQVFNISAGETGKSVTISAVWSAANWNGPTASAPTFIPAESSGFAVWLETSCTVPGAGPPTFLIPSSIDCDFTAQPPIGAATGAPTAKFASQQNAGGVDDAP